MIDLITGHQGFAHITAEQVANINNSLVNDAGKNVVIRLIDGLVTSSTLSLSVAAGYWRANGFDIELTDSETIYVDPTSAGTWRIDNFYIEILQDIASGNQRAEIVRVEGAESVYPPVSPADPTGPVLSTDIMLQCVKFADLSINESLTALKDYTITINSIMPYDWIGTLDDWDNLSQSEKLKFFGKIIYLTDQEDSVRLFTRLSGGAYTLKKIAGNPEKSNKQLYAIRNMLNAKNMLENTASTVVDSGITFTKNADGSVLVSGTASADVTYKVCDTSAEIIKNTDLFFSCLLAQGSGSSFYATLTYIKSNGVTSTTTDTGNGAVINGSDKDITWIECNIVVKAGYTFDPALMFRPMLCVNEMNDGIWTPYVKPNSRLGDELGNPSAASSVSGSSAFAKINSLYGDLGAKSSASGVTGNTAFAKIASLNDALPQNKAWTYSGNISITEGVWNEFTASKNGRIKLSGYNGYLQVHNATMHDIGSTYSASPGAGYEDIVYANCRIGDTIKIYAHHVNSCAYQI